MTIIYEETEVIENLDVKQKYIGELLKGATSIKIELAASKIANLSREELDKGAMNACLQGNRIALWLFNVEYTCRAIPPIFRKQRLDFGNILGCDFLWYDLEWLSKKHYGHKPFFKRWGKIFELKNFSHTTAGLIYSELKPEMWRNVKSLSLKNEWQVELNILKKNEYTKEWARLQRVSGVVDVALKARQHSRKVKKHADETKRIIQRRNDIWLCASLSERKPQRTANLYEALTGEKITRQVAAKVITQVKEDFSDAFYKKFMIENFD
jgi:hypothetical protein